MRPILTINKQYWTEALYVYEAFNHATKLGLKWFTVEYDYSQNTIKVWDCFGADDLSLSFRDDVDAMTVLNDRGQIKDMIEYFQAGAAKYNGQ